MAGNRLPMVGFSAKSLALIRVFASGSFLGCGGFEMVTGGRDGLGGQLRREFCCWWSPRKQIHTLSVATESSIILAFSVCSFEIVLLYPVKGGEDAVALSFVRSKRQKIGSARINDRTGLGLHTDGEFEQAQR